MIPATVYQFFIILLAGFAGLISVVPGWKWKMASGLMAYASFMLFDLWRGLL